MLSSQKGPWLLRSHSHPALLGTCCKPRSMSVARMRWQRRGYNVGRWCKYIRRILARTGKSLQYTRYLFDSSIIIPVILHQYIQQKNINRPLLYISWYLIHCWQERVHQHSCTLPSITRYIAIHKERFSIRFLGALLSPAVTAVIPSQICQTGNYMFAYVRELRENLGRIRALLRGGPGP